MKRLSLCENEMLTQCWFIAGSPSVGSGPALNQHWVDVSCLYTAMHAHDELPRHASTSTPHMFSPHTVTAELQREVYVSDDIQRPPVLPKHCAIVLFGQGRCARLIYRGHMGV